MIEIHCVALDDPALSTPECLGILDEDERARAAALRDDHLRRRHVAAHAALRRVLGRGLGRDPGELRFVRNPFGKPELAGGPFFNLSHSGALALVAVDPEAPVGIDVEVPSRPLGAGVAGLILAPGERAALAGREPDSETLHRLWVRKEAVLKAVGCGLSVAPDTVEIGLPPVAPETWRDALVPAPEARMTVRWTDLALAVPAHSNTPALPPPAPAALARLGPPASYRTVDFRP